MHTIPKYNETESYLPQRNGRSSSLPALQLVTLFVSQAIGARPCGTAYTQALTAAAICRGKFRNRRQAARPQAPVEALRSLMPRRSTPHQLSAPFDLGVSVPCDGRAWWAYISVSPFPFPGGREHQSPAPLAALTGGANVSRHRRGATGAGGRVPSCTPRASRVHSLRHQLRGGKHTSVRSIAMSTVRTCQCGVLTGVCVTVWPRMLFVTE